MARCSELKPGDQVVYRILENGRCDYADGTVVLVAGTTVHACRLEGYKSRDDAVPFADMLAKYDPNGPEARFGHIHGPSAMLEPC